ncbi:hypothetical protein KQI38_05430 [Tissierella carlieri]|uniref:phage baseplate protein n=1 Tax=Tissierella carlieri TaxID=689904 RepID=UPI001C0FD5C1|nr:hypothetical protein [Tissierella carlieri]MBU5311462.1 hypothetical protein [Tissierella carlieri]
MERAKIGDIEISVVSSENLSNRALVTEKPVEKGENVADHTKKQPIVIDLVGAVIGDDAADKLSKLMKLQKDGTLLKYIHRNALKNMVIEDINSVHSSKTKNGFTFNIRLKQIRIATAKEVEIKIASPKAKTQVKPKTNNGLQQPQEKLVSPVIKQSTTNEIVSQSLEDIRTGNSTKAILDLYLMKPPKSNSSIVRNPNIQIQ